MDKKEERILGVDEAVEKAKSAGISMAGEGRVQVFINNIGKLFLRDPRGKDILMARTIARLAKMQAIKEGIPTRLEVLESPEGKFVFPEEKRSFHAS